PLLKSLICLRTYSGCWPASFANFPSVPFECPAPCPSVPWHSMQRSESAFSLPHSALPKGSALLGTAVALPLAGPTADTHSGATRQATASVAQIVCLTSRPSASGLRVEGVAGTAGAGQRGRRLLRLGKVLVAHRLHDGVGQLDALVGQIDRVRGIPLGHEIGFHLCEQGVKLLGIGGAALDILHGDVRGQTLVGVLDGLHQVHVQFHIGGAHRAAEHCQTDDQPTDYCDEPACSQARISLMTLPYTTVGR